MSEAPERFMVAVDANTRARIEAWRANEYAQTGRIPSMADTARILLHKGLVADGFALAKEAAQ